MVIDLSTIFDDAERERDRVLDSVLSPLVFSRRRVAYPPLNIGEDEENVYIDCEVPGLRMEDLNITLANSSLSIEGERKATEGNFYRAERPSGIFQRVLQINAKVVADAIKATLRDGILRIVLPKAEEYKTRKIAISA